MADTITVQQMQDASADCKTLSDVISGAPDTQIRSRLGQMIWTIATINSKIEFVRVASDNAKTTITGYVTSVEQTKTQAQTDINKKVADVYGGYFSAFDTLANLQASTGAKTGQVAKVMNDPTAANNGDYRYTGSTWVKSADSIALDDAKRYAENLDTNRQYVGKDAFTIMDYCVAINTGNTVSDGLFTVTDFIPVEPNVTYLYSLSLKAYPNPGGVFYDENKQYISGFGVQYNTSEFSVTSPANARYVRLPSLKDYPTPYFKANGRYNISKILNITNAFRQPNALAQQPITADKYTVVGSFVNWKTGVLEKDERFNRTDFIKVEPNVNYEVSAQGFLNAGAAWFDKNKKYIAGFNNEAKTSVVSPPNAAYVIITAQKTKLQTAYFKATNERLNIDKVTNIINAYVPTRPMITETVVKSKTELLAVNKNGDSDRAYPIGRRVYDQSLRSEVYADGSFWRLPDGRPASLAPRTYVFPDWDEIRAALPTYATAYKKITDANTLTGWAKTQNNTAVNLSLSTEYGFNAVCIEKSDDSDTFVYFNNGSPIGLNTYLIFKLAGDFSTMQFLQVALFDSAGNKLFYRFLTLDLFGANGRGIYDGVDNVKVELRANDMTAAFDGASLDNVAGIGFAASRKADTIKLWVSAIETVSFKPMITLRFDDQRLSVYQNAYPVMDKYGFKGMIAVITGRPNLGNDPDINYGSINADGMTKEQLIEVRNKGWDLVSHTHTHPESWNKTDEYMRTDYQKSVDYLRKELGASELSSSILVSPFNNRNERIAQIQRKYFDAQLNQFGYNSHMPRQPEGTWDNGSLWTDLRSQIGDGNNADTLIGYAQQAIAKQRWVTVMMHDILPIPANSTNINVNDFVAFMDWLNANKNLIDVVTVSDVVKKIRPNG